MKKDFYSLDLADDSPESIFREYYSRLSYFAFQFVNDKDVAEDLVQDAFLAYWDQKKKVADHPNAIKDFLYTSVKNAALNLLKRQKVVERYFSLRSEEVIEGERILESIIEAEVMANLHQAIARLPESCRNVFLLAYFEGLSNSKIAEKLSISINTVRNHKQNGLKVLRTQLNPETFIALLVLISR